jgi:hypothetical protein
MTPSPNSDFDLLINPFVLLSVSPTATAQEIKQAHEDATEDRIAPVDVLQRALQLLLTPKLRVEAEVGGFLDVHGQLSNQVIAKLRSGASWMQMADQIAALHALPRSNVLAHLAAKSAAGLPQLMQLVRAQATVAVGSVYDAINEARELAGIGRIDRETVDQALTRLEERQTTAVVNRLTQEEAYADTFSAFVGQVLASGDSSLLQKLNTYISVYSHAAASELSRRREEVVRSCDALRSHPDDELTIDRIARALRDWNEIGQPLQAYEAHLHRDDATAREVFLCVRELCLWLANEKEQYSIALKVTRACAEVFKDLPRSLAQIQEDVEKLAELHKQQIATNLLTPLGQACEEAQQNHGMVERELLEGGFGPHSKGISGKLFKRFVEAVRSTKTTEVSDLPWAFVRNVAISLNNDSKSPKAAAAVINGLLAHVGVQRPSPAMVEFLENDKRASRKNIAQIEFGNAISSDDLAKAAALLDELLTLEKDPDEIAALHKMKAVLEQKRQSKRIKFVLGGIACGSRYLLHSNEPGQPTSP